MTSEQQLIIPDMDFVVVDAIKNKCPYRTMYEASILGKSVAVFHKPWEIFPHCRQCAGSGFYFDSEKGKDIPCPVYESVLKAREFVRNQAKQGVNQ